MNINLLKRIIVGTLFGLIVLLGTGVVADAQGDRNEQKRQQQEEKRDRQQWERRAKIEDRTIKNDQRVEQRRMEQMRNRNTSQDQMRYRVNRNGTYYQTDNRGAELLRQAVNAGYQEGYRAGRNDRTSRRSDNFRNSNVYRRGNYGYQSYVTSGQYQYYFQQGFERGYEDGYNRRSEHGTNNNGSFNILGTILQTILNIETY